MDGTIGHDAHTDGSGAGNTAGMDCGGHDAHADGSSAGNTAGMDRGGHHSDSGREDAD